MKNCNCVLVGEEKNCLRMRVVASVAQISSSYALQMGSYNFYSCTGYKLLCSYKL